MSSIQKGATQISVIMPIYNREHIIRESISSVLSQTLRNFELILVDDGSTDGSSAIVDDIAEQHPEMVMVIHQKNSGVSVARNSAIAISTGDYVAFIDSDDTWMPTKLEEQLDYMLKGKYEICQTEELWIRNGKRVNPMKKHKKPSGHIFYRSLPLCLVSPSAVMIKRTVLDEVGFFDEKLPVVEDYDLWLRLSIKYSIMTYDKPLIHKTGGHADQLSRKYWGMDRFRIYAMRKLLKEQSVNLDKFKTFALYWWIKEKSKVLYLGAKKRKNIRVVLKYYIIYQFYNKKWQGASL